MPGDPQRRDENVILFKNRLRDARKQAQSFVDYDEEKARIRTNIAALILATVLVGLGWLLVQKLGHSTKMEDCLMSGRTNCSPIMVPAS